MFDHKLTLWPSIAAVIIYLCANIFPPEEKVEPLKINSSVLDIPMWPIPSLPPPLPEAGEEGWYGAQNP